MYMKKLFLVLVSVMVLTLVVVPAAFSVDDETAAAPPPLPYYGSFSGPVVSIDPWAGAGAVGEGALLVQLENAEGGKANFIVDEYTHMLTDQELKVGAEVTGWFLNNMPMILIYPPQYQAMIMAVDVPDGQFIKVARFNNDESGNLLSDDNTLIIKSGENTEIVLNDGTPAPADLDLNGLRLAVFYDVSTRSDPAITTPKRIIVLALADAVPLPEEVPAEVKFAWDGMPLVVEDVNLTDAPPIVVLEDDTVMVPLRAAAEALGYDVNWDAATKGVRLGVAINLWIGKDEYNVGKMTPIELGAAPQLINGYTYVPLSFFKEVLGVNNAFVFEGQVDINNAEPMQ